MNCMKLIGTEEGHIYPAKLGKETGRVYGKCNYGLLVSVIVSSEAH